MSILSKIFGDPSQKIIKSMQPIVEEVNSWEEKYKKMADQEFKEKTLKFKEKIALLIPENETSEKSILNTINEELDKILPEAFAAVREASRRVLGQRPYDVQIIGGLSLHRGQIAEMKTGEGKTLVATLPLYLNSLADRGVHLVTVNDYLSRVGAGWMAPVYHFLGLTTGVIIHDLAYIYDPEYIDESQYDERLRRFRPIERREAYRCDILYGTNNEYGFDYLRDNMAPDLNRTAQRGLFYAIVDEVDSILIDEARTPLIISAPAEESTDKYFKFAQLATRLKENEDYNIDEKMRAATLTEAGMSKMEKWLGVENIYTIGGVRDAHHIDQALKAQALFKRDKDYVVKDGEIIIVDEFTGRLMHGRRYSEGLHQAIEAKEGVKVQRESQTFATITFQNYFRMYAKLSGMTGTAVTEAEEFAKIYGLETLAIPTNKPMVRNDMNDLIYRNEKGKFEAVVKEVKERNKKGQPILIGTISIEKNEFLTEIMQKNGLQPELLNAKNHEKEARIIAHAGQVGAVTIATNMAGRGVDIMLGGKEPTCAKDSDGRPKKDDPNYEEWEKWKKEHDRVVELGGLHVIGTERHEARRIDNQLRGRAGRQGDPGSSQFYVSTGDDLMRIFGGDRMKSLLTTLRLPENMPIENKMISKSIESAQKKVEGNNFDTRKHLVEYDDVINKHREAIYRKRRMILEIGAEDGENDSVREAGVSFVDAGSAEREKFDSDELASKTEDNGRKYASLSVIILEMVENEIEQVVSFHTAAESIGSWNIEEIYQVMTTIFPVEEKLKIDLGEFAKESHKLDKAKARTKIIEHLVSMAEGKYRVMEEKFATQGYSWKNLEKSILIRAIDILWVEHLEAMSSVRQGIGLRGYGQRDPLIEYKREAYRLYGELNNLIQKEVVYGIYKIGLMNEPQSAEIKAPSLADRAKNFIAPSKVMEGGSASFSGYQPAVGGSSSMGQRPGGSAPKADLVKAKVKDSDGKKVGRNDPCLCGSGKKYKKCCGK